MVSHPKALDTLRAAMVSAGRARLVAYASRKAAVIGAAEAASEAADRAYHLEYARCVASADVCERLLAARHLDAHIDTLKSIRAAA